MIYRIVRRAFSDFTEVEQVEGWVTAELRSMALQAANRDGEYLVRKMDEPNQRPAAGYVQSGFDYL